MIKLVSVNIERDLHLDLVSNFVIKESPDVVCIQELFEKDVKFFEDALGMQGYFAPMALHRSGREKIEGEELFVTGVGVFAKELHDTNFEYIYDARVDGQLPAWHNSFSEVERDIVSTVLASATVKDSDGIDYKILTTHFTRTPNGDTTEYQMADIAVMMEMLGKEKDFILCGDFNAPRQFKAFQTIASKYKDNIPDIYTTSIDSSIHRLDLPDRMVDGLFTSSSYIATGTKLVSGVSDHMAIFSNIDYVLQE